jgi:type IV pilus assembly protein PilC
MGVFSYKIKDAKGNVSSGKLEAETKDKAIEYLHSQEGIVLSLEEVKSRRKKKKVGKGKVKTDEIVIFSRQLTTLIESGIPIVESLEILFEQVNNAYFRRVIGEIVKDLKSGSSFAAAIAKYPHIFSELYCSMVRAAESSGNLPEILDRLSVYLEKSSALRKKVKSSLTYPAVVVFMAIAITAFLIFKVIPTFKDIFATLGGSLPLPTKILINVSDILRAGILYIIAAFILMFIGFKKYIATEKGKKNYHRVLLRLPVFGDLIRKVSIAQFSRTFATLVRSGVSIVISLDIVGKTSGNKIIEQAVMNAKDSIQEGVPISEPLQQSGVFPPMVVKMIAVGERTGKLEHMLAKVAQFYEEQTDAVISSLTSLIEPLVIAFLGVVIGGIVVSLFLPIIKITTLLGG